MIKKSVLLFGVLCTFTICSKGQNTQDKSLEEIIISGNIFPEKRKNIVQKVDVISKKEITEMDAQTTADVLTNTGNVFVQKSQQGGGSPVLRGFEANKILMSIDGIRYNNAIFRGGHLQNIIAIDNYALESIEVLNGPASTLHGSDALGGVILLRTRNPIFGKSKKWTITSADGMLRTTSANKGNAASVSFSYGNKKFAGITVFTNSYFGELQQGKNGPDSITNLWKKKFYVDRINGKDSMMRNANPFRQIGTAYNQFDLLQKFQFKPNKNTLHSLNFQLSKSDNIPRYDRLTETDAAGIAKSAEWYYGPQVRSLTAYKFEAVKLRGFFDDFSATASHQFWNESRNNRSFGSDQLNQRDEKINVLGYNLSLRKKGKIHELSMGTDAQFNILQSEAKATDINTGEVSKIDTRYPDGKNNMNLFGLFVQHTMKLQEGKLVINDGLRFNYTQLHSTLLDTALLFHLPTTDLRQNNTALTGNIGLAYMPEKALRFTLNFSTGFRAPNFDDMTKIFESNKNQLIVPNQNLKPEYTQNFELGMQHHSSFTSFNAYGFYTNYTNAIVTDFYNYNGADSVNYNGNMTRVFASQNKAKAFLYGAGADITIHPTDELSLFASINYTLGRFDQDSSLTPLDHIPPTIGRLGMGYTKKLWYSELYSLYNGKKTLNNYNLGGEDNLQYATPNGMPAWLTLNFRMGITIMEHFKLQAGIENILDKNYRYFASGMSAPGRNFVLSLRYQF